MSAVDRLVNNNDGNTGTSQFTQSEASLVAFGNTIVLGFQDSGSFATGSKFTGFSRSTNGGASFTDMGTLPTNPVGDAGYPVLVRNDVTGRIYFNAISFSSGIMQVYRSDDNGATWMPPVNGTPGGANEDKPWLAIDNFPGSGNGNLYLVSRSFGVGNGIFLYRSTDHGATFSPNGGLPIVSGNNGAFVAIGPDHSVYVFWLAGTAIQMRKSTNLGVSFGSSVPVVSGLSAPGGNGDLGLTGVRQGTISVSGFRSNSYPHVAINPVSGHIYVTYNDNPSGADKADVYMTMSTNGGTSWSAPVRINDDATTTDQWMPTIAVTPAGDQIGIFYYSRQEDQATNNLFRYYARIGAISGSLVTFGPSSAVSDTPSLPEFGRDSIVNSVYMGDYNTAYATPGVFHVIWADNRDDLPGGGGRKDPNVYYDQVTASSTGVPEGGAPLALQWMHVSPNPFRGSTTVAFDQGREADVTLGVYGVKGALLETITQGRRGAGRQAVAWNGGVSGGTLPAGVYFLRLTVDGRSIESKIVKLP